VVTSSGCGSGANDPGEGSTHGGAEVSPTTPSTNAPQSPVASGINSTAATPTATPPQSDFTLTFDEWGDINFERDETKQAENRTKYNNKLISLSGLVLGYDEHLLLIAETKITLPISPWRIGVKAARPWLQVAPFSTVKVVARVDYGEDKPELVDGSWDVTELPEPAESMSAQRFFDQAENSPGQFKGEGSKFDKFAAVTVYGTVVEFEPTDDESGELVLAESLDKPLLRIPVKGQHCKYFQQLSPEEMCRVSC